ncbi:hypothetical protein CBA19C8_13680 [Paraburkholderia terrae]|nr:hypothetical protein CBA19C8_13680 [Paraburkholderia terrae]
MTSNSRRRFLKTAATSAGAAAAVTMLPESIRNALAVPANSRTGSIRDVEHIVVFMQENRSFDHYFGHMRGVRGYNDRFPIPLPNGKPVWYQPSKADPTKPVLPFHLNTQTTSAQCVGDLDHSWYKTHGAIDGGRYDQWPANKTDMTMGYHLRSDIPFHYALADAFTICDAYFCSLPGPTHPNRSYLMTGMVDPTGTKGGPLLDNNDFVDGDVPPKYQLLSWTTYPERLEAAGISWQIYQQGTDGSDPLNGNYGTNILQNFENFINAQPGSSLFQRAQTVRTIDALKADVQANRLPQVSWLCPPAAYSEHPKYTPAYGAEYTSQILDALTSNPEVWSKTVLFIMYDENDGFFDHVVPPQVATSRAQGLSTVTADGEIHDVVNPGRGGSYTADNLPYGLGPRVPMTIVSPWTKGGFVCSQVFDHTSVIRFIESRFGVHEPNITAWRRAVCGDLTTAFDFRTPDAKMPPLPDTSNYKSMADNQCATQPAPTVPAVPGAIDPQETGIRFARALPYELHVNGKVDEKANSLTIEFGNTGSDATGSPSIKAGSSAPSTSAPARSASSSNVTVPLRVSMPDCGNATVCMSSTSRSASRVFSTPSRCLRPASVSISTCVRKRVVPACRKARASASDAAAASCPLCARKRRSFSMRSVSLGPTSLRYQGMPHIVLSRCVWPSTKPGNSRAPFAFSCATSFSTRKSGPIASMRPLTIATSTHVPSGKRASTINSGSFMQTPFFSQRLCV